MPRKPSPGRPPGQYTQAVRLFRLFQLLEANPEGVRIEDASRELGVTARSIRRDLKALEQANTDIEHVDLEGERRVRRARTGRLTEPIRLTRFQRYSLAAVRRVFDVLAGTPLHDDVTQLYARLFPSGEDDGAMVERFVYIPEAPKNYRKLKDQIYDIYEGTLRTFTLGFQYESPNGQTTARKVEPYALVLYQNGLYVVGRDTNREAMRTFAVERMRRVRVLNNLPFKRDPAVDVSKMFEGAFGLHSGSERQHVVVDFTAEVARYIEPREWHATQKMTRLEDGGLRVEFDVTSLTEVESWVMRWGPSAIAREPAVLVERIRELHAQAVARYATA
jgi:predicted DNA-binding transcriptional regulator YafY